MRHRPGAQRRILVAFLVFSLSLGAACSRRESPTDDDHAASKNRPVAHSPENFVPDKNLMSSLQAYREGLRNQCIARGLPEVTLYVRPERNRTADGTSGSLFANPEHVFAYATCRAVGSGDVSECAKLEAYGTEAPESACAFWMDAWRDWVLGQVDPMVDPVDCDPRGYGDAVDSEPESGSWPRMCQTIEALRKGRWTYPCPGSEPTAGDPCPCGSKCPVPYADLDRLFRLGASRAADATGDLRQEEGTALVLKLLIRRTADPGACEQFRREVLVPFYCTRKFG